VRALSLRRAHAAAAPGARHAHSTVMVPFLASFLTPLCGATAAALGPKYILMLMRTSRSLTQCIDNLDGADGPSGWQHVGIQASLSAGKPASRPPETGPRQAISSVPLASVSNLRRLPFDGGSCAILGLGQFSVSRMTPAANLSTAPSCGGKRLAGHHRRAAILLRRQSQMQQRSAGEMLLRRHVLPWREKCAYPVAIAQDALLELSRLIPTSDEDEEFLREVNLPSDGDGIGPLSPVLRAVRAAAFLFLAGERGPLWVQQECIRIGILQAGIAVCLKTMEMFSDQADILACCCQILMQLSRSVSSH